MSLCVCVCVCVRGCLAVEACFWSSRFYGIDSAVPFRNTICTVLAVSYYCDSDKTVAEQYIRAEDYSHVDP